MQFFIEVNCFNTSISKSNKKFIIIKMFNILNKGIFPFHRRLLFCANISLFFIILR